MRRLCVSIGLLASLLAPPAYAQQYGQHVWEDLGRIKSSVACNAAEATRTWTSRAGQGSGYALGAFQLNVTRDAVGNTLTAFTWECYGSLDHGTTWALLQSCEVSSGTCTSSDAIWDKAVTTSKNVLWRVDFLGAPDVRCVLTCTGGGALDTTTIYGRMSAQ